MFTLKQCWMEEALISISNLVMSHLWEVWYISMDSDLTSTTCYLSTVSINMYFFPIILTQQSTLSP